MAVQLEQVRGAGVGREVGLDRRASARTSAGPRRSGPARRWRRRSRPVRSALSGARASACRPSRSASAKSCRDIASEPRPASAAASRGASSTARSSSRLALVYQVGSPSSRAICSSAKARLSYAEGSRGAAASAAVKRSICDRVLSPGEGSGATSGAAAARSACVGSGLRRRAAVESNGDGDGGRGARDKGDERGNRLCNCVDHGLKGGERRGRERPRPRLVGHGVGSWWIASKPLWAIPVYGNWPMNGTSLRVTPWETPLVSLPSSAPASAFSSMSVALSASRRPFGKPALSPPRTPSGFGFADGGMLVFRRSISA